jgi:hypothetical protein
MAYPADPLNSNAGDQGVSNEPTREYLEQLASAIRPSWELDDATFSGPSAASSADVAGLNGTKEATALRTEIGASNGSFAPSRATVAEATGRAIVETGVSRASVVPVVDAPHRRPAAPAAAPSMSGSPRLPSPRLQLASVPPAGSASVEIEVPAVGRSRKPLWIVLTVGAVALIGIGGWAASGGDAGGPVSAAPTRVPTTAASRPPVVSGPSHAQGATTTQGLRVDGPVPAETETSSPTRVPRPSAPASNSPPRAIPEPISPPPRAIPEPIAAPPPRAIPEPVAAPPPRAVPQPVAAPPPVATRAPSVHEATPTEPPRPSSRPLPSGPIVRDVPF